MTTSMPILCNVPWYSMLVMPGGEVKPSCRCGMLAGNLNTASLMEIWNGPVYTELRDRLLHNDFSLCGDCYSHRQRHKIFDFPEGTSTAFRLNMAKKKRELATGATLLESGPVDIEMTPYYDCNLKCRMCEWHERKGAWTPKVSAEIQQTLQYAAHIYLTGGEPLLHFESVFWKILNTEGAKDNQDLRITIVTNGNLLTESFMAKYLRHLPLKRVNVSTHATTEKTYRKIIPNGNWRKTQNALHILLELQKTKDFEVMANFVIQKENYHELSGFVTHCEEKGILTRLIRGNGKGKIDLLPSTSAELAAEIDRALEVARDPFNIDELRKIKNFYAASGQE